MAEEAAFIPDDKPTSRLERMVGAEGVSRLASATVMVLGVGGVGSNCLEALARGGIGNLIIVDHDTVAASNINRQAVAFHSTLGQKKIDVMTKMIADINPQCRVTALDRFILAEDLPDLFDEYVSRADYLIDAIDTISTKLAIAQIAQEKSVRLVSSMGGGNKTDPTTLRFADIYDTVNCRLCRVMRKEGRKRGIKSLRVLYSCQEVPPATAQPGTQRNERTGLGTMSYFPPIMGQMIAGDVIQSILGDCLPTLSE